MIKGGDRPSRPWLRNLFNFFFPQIIVSTGWFTFSEDNEANQIVLVVCQTFLFGCFIDFDGYGLPFLIGEQLKFWILDEIRVEFSLEIDI